MTEDSGGITDSLARLPQRVTTLLELLTTLDQRILTALDGLEEMRRSLAPLEGLGESGDGLISDIRASASRFEERVNQDLDELKGLLIEKLGELDLGDFSARFDRLESAVLNIERATVNLDQAFEGGLEMLPDFVTKRLKSEGRKAAPPPTTE